MRIRGRRRFVMPGSAIGRVGARRACGRRAGRMLGRRRGSRMKDRVIAPLVLLSEERRRKKQTDQQQKMPKMTRLKHKP